MPLYCALQYHYSLDFSEFIAHPFAGLRRNDSSYRGHSVSPIAASLTVFACVFGGVLVGMWLRSTLPKYHLDAESRDTVKVGIGLIATMTALVLGLVTAAAKSSFDSGSAAVKQAAMNILAVDRALARYGPETGEIREGMKDLLAARIDAIWSHGLSEPSNTDPRPMKTGFASVEEVAEAIRALKPRDDLQRAAQSRASDLTEAVLQARWLAALGVVQSSVPLPFLCVLVFWLTVTFTSLPHETAQFSLSFSFAPFRLVAPYFWYWSWMGHSTV